MKAFSALWLALNTSSSDEEKLQALVHYLQQAPKADAAWAVHLLGGGKFGRIVPLSDLQEHACAWAGIPAWLFDASHAVVGERAETIAHLIPIARHPQTLSLAEWMEQQFVALREMPAAEKWQRLRELFDGLPSDERVLVVKLITGSFRGSVPSSLLQRAIAQAFGLRLQQVAQRMQAGTAATSLPSVERFERIIEPDADPAQRRVQPFAFCCAEPWHGPPAGLGALDQWLVEWKRDGLRVQILRRGGLSAVWSRQDELLNERVPQIIALADRLPDGTVLDGQLMFWPAGAGVPAGKAQLLEHLARKPSRTPLPHDASVRLAVFDLLEVQNQDLRGQSLATRRAALQRLAADQALPLTELVRAVDWDHLNKLQVQARRHGAAGLILKPLNSRYVSPNRQSEAPWRVWKAEPLVVNGVLLYAEAASGRAPSPASFSFAVWSRAPADTQEIDAVLQDIRQGRAPDPKRLHLVPFAKLPAQACGTELRHLVEVAQAQTVGHFGPVRSLLPCLVVTLGFEAISRSKRHKSGVCVLSPRLLRVNDGQTLMEVEPLANLRALLNDDVTRGA